MNPKCFQSFFWNFFSLSPQACFIEASKHFGLHWRYYGVGNVTDQKRRKTLSQPAVLEMKMRGTSLASRARVPNQTEETHCAG